MINPVKKLWMAVDRVQDGEKDSRNFLPLSHCSSRVAFPRVHFCQRVTIYDTATVTGLCAATTAVVPATRQSRRNFQVLVAVQSTILTVTNDARLLTPSWLFFQKLITIHFRGKMMLFISLFPLIELYFLGGSSSALNSLF